MSVPVVLLTIPAKLVADWLFPGIYEWQIAAAGYPFVEALDNLTCREQAAMYRRQVCVRVQSVLYVSMMDAATAPHPPPTLKGVGWVCGVTLAGPGRCHPSPFSWA
jgi:hypothetical protein